MNELLKEFSNRMIEIKYAFVETNNRLLARFEDVNSRNMDSPNLIHPYLSNNARNILNKGLGEMQETAVNSIGTCFNKFYTLAMDVRLGSQTPPCRRFEKDIIDTLEGSFKENQHPSDKEKARIQEMHGITHQQISNWFTNRRNKLKSKPRNKQSKSASSAEDLEDNS